MIQSFCFKRSVMFEFEPIFNLYIWCGNVAYVNSQTFQQEKGVEYFLEKKIVPYEFKYWHRTGLYINRQLQLARLHASRS